MLVKGFVCHGTIGRGRDEVKLLGKLGGMGFEDLNHEFPGPVEMLLVHAHFNYHGVVLQVAFANGDSIGNKVDFEISGLGFDNRLEDVIDKIMAMEVGMHHANEAGGGDIKGCAEAMIAKEEAIRLKPGEESVIELEVVKGLVTAEADEDTQGLGVLMDFAGSILEISKELGNAIIGRKVSGHHEGWGHGCFFDGEDSIGRVHLLEFLEEVQEQSMHGEWRGVSSG